MSGDAYMQSTWGQLIAVCEGAGLGNVWLHTNNDRKIVVEFEHARSWSHALTVSTGDLDSLEVVGFGERWTDLEALRAYLARLGLELAGGRAA